MPQSAETVIRRAYEAFANRDVETLYALSSGDVRISTVTGVLAQREEPYLGRDGIVEYLDDVRSVWDELDVEPVEFHELSAGGCLVYGRVRARRGSMRIDAANAWRWRVEDGLITSVDVFGDLAGAAELLAE